MAHVPARGSQARSERQPEQRAALEALAGECRRRGWQLIEVGAEAGFSAEELERPGIKEALAVRASDEAKALVAGKRDRPPRVLIDLACLLASAQRQGWALVALDCAAETASPGGEATVTVLASFAPCERELLSKRIRQALARRRAQGVRLGRPPTMSPYALERIRRERVAGKTLAAIAHGLNADRVPTAQGGHRWYPATVRYTLTRAQ
jgi:DNA invertase Pin-like site-specific DNA recombinase